MRTAARIAGLVLVGLVLVGVGIVGGIVYVDERDAIDPVPISQFYGVSAGTDEQGRYCIDSESDGRRCALLRLRDGDEIPPAGGPIRGGYSLLPSDSSDPPEPSWIWLTPLACLLDTSNDDLRCP